MNVLHNVQDKMQLQRKFNVTLNTIWRMILNVVLRLFISQR